MTDSATSPDHTPPIKPISSLAGLQQAMGSYILTGTLAPIAAQVNAHGALSAEQRLHIYHNAYRMRLLEVLQDHFAQTHAYLGDAFFEAEALAYVEAHPPEADNLRHYGQQWPQWIAQRYPNDLDMADLSRLEWALRTAFDAADTPVATWDSLATLTPDDWGRIGFQLAAGTQVLHLDYAVLPLWQALVSGQVPEAVAHHAHNILIWRRDGQPHFKSLSTAEATVLRALLADLSFEQACAQVSHEHPEVDVSPLAGAWLHTWVADALLAAPSFR